MCEKSGTESSDYCASEGWLKVLKASWDQTLTLQGEKPSADQPAAEKIVVIFLEFVEENHYEHLIVMNLWPMLQAYLRSLLLLPLKRLLMVERHKRNMSWVQ